MADVFGFNFPFLRPTFVLPPQTDERIIKNDIKQLLLTSPGERVMRPDFGTPIRETVFEPMDESTLVTLQEQIRDAINTFEPRVIFREANIIAKPGNNLIEIHVIVAMSRDPNRILAVDVTFVTGPNNVNLPTQQPAI
jgi:phage baseplate assembly protein W